MGKLILASYIVLTAGALGLTYYNVGLKGTETSTQSVRSGSSSSAGVYYGSGGYRGGK